jgi:hypothetical protein
MEELTSVPIGLSLDRMKPLDSQLIEKGQFCWSREKHVWEPPT